MLKYNARQFRYVVSRYIVAIAAAAAAGIIAAIVLYGDIPYRMQDGKEITVTGRMVCLPHERELFGGPETEECAFGFRSNSSKQYAISNLQEVSQEEPALQKSVGTVRQFALTGTFTYGDYQNYDVVGLIDVDSVISEIDR
jgi:hypothetical protein